MTQTGPRVELSPCGRWWKALAYLPNELGWVYGAVGVTEEDAYADARRWLAARLGGNLSEKTIPLLPHRPVYKAPRKRV